MTEFIITCESELQKDGSYKIERYRELVRCKDCRFKRKTVIPYLRDTEVWCYRMEKHMKKVGFCSEGER